MATHALLVVVPNLNGYLVTLPQMYFTQEISITVNITCDFCTIISPLDLSLDQGYNKTDTFHQLGNLTLPND